MTAPTQADAPTPVTSPPPELVRAADVPVPVGRGERLALAVGAIGLAVAVIATRAGVFTPDTRPDLYQRPGRFLVSALEAWVGGASGLGQANFNAGAAPVAAVVWVIRALGAPAWLSVRIWRLLLLFVAGWGIRRYLTVLLGRRLTAAGRLLATVFWVANPYVIVAGSTTPILLPYALLPWTMLAFVHACRRPRSWRWPAAFALAFFAQTGLNAGVVPFFQLLALPAHVVFARYVEGQRWRQLLGVVARCGALAVAVSLYWLLPSFLASSTGAGIAGSTESPRDVARTSSYAESGRLLGNWPLYGRAGDRLFLGDYTTYLTNPLVVLATFATPVAVGLVLWRARARERLLVVVLLATALPVMVGLFPPDDPYPAGRFLATVFDRVPASLAFRTTNKVGAVVVLAECLALALGVRAWERRTRSAGRRQRWAALALVALLLVGGAAPLWNGGLYPLGYRIPQSWQDATAELDDHDHDRRVLVVPGGTGGNYRWGMRSPDDLFPSLLGRPVAVRNTVVGRGDPAGNFLSAFDTALAEGSLPDGALSAVARSLGASDVLVRSDLLIEEISGPVPTDVVRAAGDDPGLTLARRWGRRGTDTVPGRSGPAPRSGRGDAAIHPLVTYRVAADEPVVRAVPASAQLLVDGDGAATVALAGAGLADGTQPMRLLGDLDRGSFAQAVRDGGRVVLTDTNRRRAWDINRVANATSPTLTATGDVDAGNGATTTRWPDASERQTVSLLAGARRIVASRPAFGLFPFGRPSNAFDGDPTTAWITGGFGTATGASIRVELDRPRTVQSVTVTPQDTEPSRITSVIVRVGGASVLQAVPPGGAPVTISFKPALVDEVELTVRSQTAGANPVGIASIGVDDLVVRESARLPETYSELVSSADAPTRRAALDLPLDLVLARAQGQPRDGTDDEESQLDRDWSLPAPRFFTFRAELSAAGVPPAVVSAARAGRGTCVEVARLDGAPVRARVVSAAGELDDGQVLLQGCEPVRLDAGDHQLRTIFGWRLDRAVLSSVAGGDRVVSATGSRPETARRAPRDTSLRVVDRSATRVDVQIGASRSGARLLRLGEAYDERWSLSVDGRDAGPPTVIDGYASGWRIDGRAHHLVATFGPQTAVDVTFAVSLVAVVGVVGVALLPVPGVVGRRRRRRDEEER